MAAIRSVMEQMEKTKNYFGPNKFFEVPVKAFSQKIDKKENYKLS